ncbi:acyl-CoA thioesterase [Actinoplanes sp. NPDC049265]|uniref:acyl-CoA thioesterase n=1 Tax=Actinoplanes sp. NPDC049265 TaxID=3363902 RepID=UPI003721EAF1
MTRYVYDAAVRWSDMDVYGHVNNARFLTLYEEARVAMFFTAARAQGLTSFEEGIVIARHEVDYLRPVDYGPRREAGDPASVDSGAGSAGAASSPRVRIEMWISQLRASRFTVAYELFDEGNLAGRAKSVCVPYNLAEGFPRRLSEAERHFLEPYVEE